MYKNSEARYEVDGDPNQMSVVLLGTSLSFSDQMVRFLAFEFPEVRFKRVGSASEVYDIVPRPRLVVLHESVPDLAAVVDWFRGVLGGSMIAVACSELPLCYRDDATGVLREVSFLRTNAQIDVWLSVLRLLLCGQAYVPPEFLREWHREPARRSHDPEPRGNAAGAVGAQLTPREMQILPLIARGMQNKTIAGELGLSEHTVKLHTHNIFSKLKVSNRTGAAGWYLSQIEGSAAAR